MINNVEIITCKLVLFKNTIIDFINQEISAERERSIETVNVRFCSSRRKMWKKYVPVI
jgi:hypothetical protein